MHFKSANPKMLSEIPSEGYIFSLVVGFQLESFSKNELFKKIFQIFCQNFLNQSLNCSLQIGRSLNVLPWKVDFTISEEMLFAKEIYKICFIIVHHIF